MILKAAHSCFWALLRDEKISAIIAPKWGDLDDEIVSLSFNKPRRPSITYSVDFIDIIRISDLSPHQLKRLGFLYKEFVLEYTGILIDKERPYYYIEITPIV